MSHVVGASMILGQPCTSLLEQSELECLVCGTANRGRAIQSDAASDEVQTQRSRCSQVLGHEETKCL